MSYYGHVVLCGAVLFGVLVGFATGSALWGAAALVALFFLTPNQA